MLISQYNENKIRDVLDSLRLVDYSLDFVDDKETLIAEIQQIRTSGYDIGTKRKVAETLSVVTPINGYT